MTPHSLQVTAVVRLFLALWLAITPTFAWAGSMTLLGAGGPAAAAPSYTGPGDIVSGATVWGSCARVYDAALASTSTSLCDLVAVTGGAAVCTLRGSASGLVDLAASYCAGTTPAAACAAASGGSCKITKIYDQTGTGNHISNATLAQMPALTFSALGGLPGITCNSATASFMSTPAVTQAQPVSFSSVFERTANPTNGTLILGINASSFGPAPLAAEFRLDFGSGGLTTGATVTESTFHATQGVVNGASSTIAIDALTPTTGNAGTNAYSAVALRFCKNGASLDGIVMEVGLWPSAFNATQYGNLNTNQHSATVGYNF